MHAYLVTGASAVKRQDEAEKIIKKNAIGELLRMESPASKHHIQVIRELNHKLSLKPLNTQKGRAVIIEDAQLLTQEASNCFLKTLEEPPEDTIIILTAPNKDLVIETVSSRCQHIDLVGYAPRVDPSEIKEAQDILMRLLQGGVGVRLTLAEVYAQNRTTALNFVIGQTFAARELLFNRLNSPLQSIEVLQAVELVERLEQTRQDLETGVNVKLTIFNLLLNYPASSKSKLSLD